MNSSLCKKRKQDIIANCGDETNLLIELLAVMVETEAAHDSRVKNTAIDDSQCLVSTIWLGVLNLTECLDTKLCVFTPISYRNNLDYPWQNLYNYRIVSAMLHNNTID